jgi:PAS domain-containing protein
VFSSLDVTALIRIERSWTPTHPAERPKPIRFCSRCGHPSDEPAGRPELRRRICDRCGMGMLLSCARDALPGDAAAFVICTYDLTVTAVSQAGERFFGKEEEVMGRHLLDLVTSPLGDDQLARHAGLAAQRACDPVVMPLRLASERANGVGTLAARIATCGPPRAALVTVEPSEFGRR